MGHMWVTYGSHTGPITGPIWVTVGKFFPQKNISRIFWGPKKSDVVFGKIC